ncbi:MAG: GDSL family lipase [Acidobacteria bacterium]|nr:MAG: GDSL family lipase [Acidobacteriota bacterium]
MVFVVAWSGQLAIAQNGNEHWVSTWAASPLLRAQPAQQQPNAAPLPPNSFNNQTLRMIVRTSIGGRRIRLQLSNAFGSSALTVGAAHVALHSKDSAVVEGSDRALAFNGKPSTMIPAGALVLSDPVDLYVLPLSDLAISLYFPGETGPATMHATGLRTTYISKQGDMTTQPAITDATTSQSWYWISSVDVLAPAAAAAIVTFGDSITDGARSTPDANRSWPSFLAQRLLSNKNTANLAVLNQGISGNRLLRDGTAVNALARFDRDVLAQAGVKWVTLLEGINDIGRGYGTNAAASDAVTADELIGALRQMIERAHTHGIKVIGCTLTPYAGAGYYSEKGEAIREAVNRWIRTSGAFDAVIDFDAATRDPKNTKQFRAEFDSGDHLHPNDAGYKAMAESISLSIFDSKK